MPIAYATTLCKNIDEELNPMSTAHTELR